jgi:hypothetical protein
MEFLCTGSIVIYCLLAAIAFSKNNWDEAVFFTFMMLVAIYLWDYLREA